MLYLSPNTKMTVIFVTILLVGGPYGASIKTMKIISLSMVLGFYLVQSVSIILANTSFELTLFT